MANNMKYIVNLFCWKVKYKCSYSCICHFAGSTKDLIETCCAAGQQWGIDNNECADIPISGTDGDICRYVHLHVR